MGERKKQILDMVSEGKITPEEGVELLSALEGDRKEVQP